MFPVHLSPNFKSPPIEVPPGFHFLELYEPPEYTNKCDDSASVPGSSTGDKADMWQFGILTVDLLTNMKLTTSRNSRFVLWHHDVWPFLEKLLQHQEYLEYLMEDSFTNVMFDKVDLDTGFDFISKILCLDPEKRMTARQAMEHEFMNVEWPQLPNEYSLPKVVVEHHHESLPLPKDKEESFDLPAEKGTTAAYITANIMGSKEGASTETPSGEAIDALKKKKEKMQGKKLDRRESIIADADKNTVKVADSVASLLRQKNLKKVVNKEPSNNRVSSQSKTSTIKETKSDISSTVRKGEDDTTNTTSMETIPEEKESKEPSDSKSKSDTNQESKQRDESSEAKIHRLPSRPAVLRFIPANKEIRAKNPGSVIDNIPGIAEKLEMKRLRNLAERNSGISVSSRENIVIEDNPGPTVRLKLSRIGSSISRMIYPEDDRFSHEDLTAYNAGDRGVKKQSPSLKNVSSKTTPSRRKSTSGVKKQNETVAGNSSASGSNSQGNINPKPVKKSKRKIKNKNGVTTSRSFQVAHDTSTSALGISQSTDLSGRKKIGNPSAKPPKKKKSVKKRISRKSPPTQIGQEVISDSDK